jgi:GFO/IDH/MocA oxidoreductase family protein
LLPEGLMEQHSGKNAPTEKIPRIKGQSHAMDWADAIRNGRPAGSNFDYGGPLTEVALLGLIALRFPGQTLSWDAKAMRFTNNDEANALLRSSYRSGWTV